jgi:hypothetical protein
MALATPRVKNIPEVDQQRQQQREVGEWDFDRSTARAVSFVPGPYYADLLYLHSILTQR